MDDRVNLHSLIYLAMIRCDTVNVGKQFPRVVSQLMNSPKNRRPRKTEEPALPFDVTQEIDLALADELRRSAEPTLTQGDFDDITIVLPGSPDKKR